MKLPRSRLRLAELPLNPKRPLPASVAAGLLAAPALVVLAATPAAAAPAHQMPFPCNEVWSGQTRTDHSPANAVDFNRSGDDGDAVVASAAGTVSRVANTGSTSYGLWIEIDHGSGFTSRYAHLSGEFVSVGQSVARGEQIGTLGTSGGSTGPHLHYEQLSGGSPTRIVFNGSTITYWGTANYTSRNSCTGRAVTVNTSGAALTIRSGPYTSNASIGSAPDGGTLRITCYRRGTSVTGTYGTSDIWNRVGGGFAADSYLYTGSDQPVVPAC